MIDLTKETDINKIKALAFDEMVKLEQAQRNLQMLQARIAELAQPPVKEKSNG